MKKLMPIATGLVIVGALNWGLVGVAKFDLVAWVFGEDFGQTNVASRIVYVLVGIAAVVLAGSLLSAGRDRHAARATADTA
jgi:uncharacterized membrane protein YuzA (DUF378 family)